MVLVMERARSSASSRRRRTWGSGEGRYPEDRFTVMLTRLGIVSDGQMKHRQSLQTESSWSEAISNRHRIVGPLNCLLGGMDRGRSPRHLHSGTVQRRRGDRPGSPAAPDH